MLVFGPITSVTVSDMKITLLPSLCFVVFPGPPVTNVMYNDVPHHPVRNMKATPVVRINCSHEGAPQPNITWLHNGRPLRTYGRLTVSDYQLRVNPITPSDSGFYQCTARNSVGSSRAAAELRVTLAGEPHDLHILSNN